MLSTYGHGPKRAVLCTRIPTDEQARSGYSLAQQIEADYIEQLPAPGSIRGTEGQHRNDGSRCGG